MSESISVIIPTWNRADSLVCAIKSALAQTLPPLEILVCDDGSTDETEKVLSAFNDDRVVWLPGKRTGLPACPRNRGILKSRGNWIAFLDDDDAWLPNKLQRQIDALRISGCLASCCDAFRVKSNTDELLDTLLDLKNERLDFDDLLEVNKVICSSVLVRKDILLIAGGFSENASLKAGEDYALWLRIATLTGFAVVPEPLLIYLDIPHQSVRKDGMDAENKYLAVLDDFHIWASNNCHSRYTWRAKRIINKLSGKSLFETVMLDLLFMLSKYFRSGWI